MRNSFWQVRCSILALQCERGLRRTQLFSAIDINRSFDITEDEFVRAFVERFGFEGSSTVLERIWRPTFRLRRDRMHVASSTARQRGTPVTRIGLD